MCKKDNALATFLVDKPRKYKYNPYPTHSEDVLFLLLPLTEIEFLRAIDLS